MGIVSSKHLLEIGDFSPSEIMAILDLAKSFKEVNDRTIKKLPTLRGRTIINMFLEPSTRTRTSFEIAAKRLSADALGSMIPCTPGFLRQGKRACSLLTGRLFQSVTRLSTTRSKTAREI